jgi:hypothetical protein
MEDQTMHYFDLISSLLQCPGGQELQILNAHYDLVDSGLLIALDQTAAEFESRGSAKVARSLHKLSEQIAPLVDAEQSKMSYRW